MVTMAAEIFRGLVGKRANNFNTSEWRRTSLGVRMAILWLLFVSVVSCTAIGCTTRHEEALAKRFFRFQSNEARKRRWCAAVNRQTMDGQPWTPSKSDRVCGLHFALGEPRKDETHCSPCVNSGYDEQSDAGSCEAA